MKVLEKTNYRDSLLADLQNDPGGYIGFALQEHACCFRVAIMHDEFASLLLNSSPNDPQPQLLSRYPTLAEVIAQIDSNLDFLTTSIAERGLKEDYRGLNGERVNHYLDLFDQGMGLGECFIRDKLLDMREDGSYYIVDGMHRLVAYGLSTKMDTKSFPIPLYFCTNSPLE